MKSLIISKKNYNNFPKNLHVVVLVGGIHAEREVSLVSGEGVCIALEELGYKVTVIDMGKDIAEILINLKPDIVFNSLHGGYGENGSLPGLLEILEIPYTHSGVLASAIGMNKLRSRDVFMNNGFKFPEMVLIHKDNIPKSDPLPRPYVIKPISEGSSLGVNVVFEQDNFSIQDYEFKYGDTAIIEKYVPGREIQVAIVGDKPIGVMEIRPKGRFYDYDAKYTDGFAEHIYPAPIPEEAYNKVMELAIKAHNLLGCENVSRVEFRFDDTENGDNEFYILEVNTHPGFTPLSIVPDIARHHNISFNDLVESLIQRGLRKSKKS